VTRARVAALSVAALLVGTALSGCGVSEETMRPGQAAQVGDDAVSLADVDDATTALCGFYDDAQFTDASPVPRSIRRREVAQTLIIEAALRQMLDERDLAIGDDYGASLTEIEAGLAEVERDRDELLEVFGSAAYVDAGLSAIGLAADTPEPDAEGALPDATQQGLDEVAAWLGDHDVDINPILALELTDEGLTPAAGELSVPVSDRALSSTFDLTDPATSDKIDALVATLPADQVCGA
jgi:hypothetical protein